MPPKKRIRDKAYCRKIALASYYRHRPERLAAAKKWRLNNSVKNEVCKLRNRETGAVGNILSSIKNRARRQGVAFNLTVDWWLAHFSQGCAVTGLDLAAPLVGRGVRRSGGPWSPHVDRIKAGGDYTMDNCRIVCGLYNKARCNWSDADVMKMAKALVAY